MKKYIIIIWLVCAVLYSKAQKQDSIRDISELSIEEIINLKVVTASLKEEKIITAPSNITVITKAMIEDRGYQTLVEICEDLPGFDFLIFNDGAGEITTFSKNRGVGDMGNQKILIMVDGIIQNSISFNWSTLWSYEALLHNLDRIEVIQGTGSAIYGAQAFTGIINFITKSNYEGIYASAGYGVNNTMEIKLLYGTKVSEDFNLSASLKKYNTDGDDGNRYDPGNYFHGHVAPYTLTENFDESGEYVTNVPNPRGGEPIPDGFANWYDALSCHLKLSNSNSEFGAFFWDFDRGSSCYLAGYEYYLTGKNHRSHQRGYHVYGKSNYKLTSRLSLESNIVYRTSIIMPETGIEYPWRFPGLTKSYSAYSKQGYIEERLNYNFNNNDNLLFGFRAMTSTKSERVISIGQYSDLHTSRTEASWDNRKEGIFQPKDYPSINVLETALYALFNKELFKDYLSISFGIRYDNSSEFGSIFNPRAALIFNNSDKLTIKALYGSAFRQPSIFELTGEYYGNPDLEPEKVTTYELELNSHQINNTYLKMNVFYSDMSDFISFITDTTMPSGKIYDNIEGFKVRGFSVTGNYRPFIGLHLYANYMFTQGKEDSDSSWDEIEKIALNKINFGVNYLFWKKRINLNLRVNYVGKRKAQAENKWLQTYENGYCPSYKKVNFVLTYKGFKKIQPQIIIKNLFNEQFYGIGRLNGSGFVDEYDPLTNPNPSGYVPAYHPQPGRTIMINIKFEINEKNFNI